MCFFLEDSKLVSQCTLMWVVFGICFSEDRRKNILNYAKIVSGTDFWGWTEFRVLFFLMETSCATLILILKDMKLFELTFNLPSSA